MRWVLVGTQRRGARGSKNKHVRGAVLVFRRAGGSHPHEGTETATDLETGCGKAAPACVSGNRIISDTDTW